MTHRWVLPGVVTLLGVALVILMGQGLVGQALAPSADLEVAKSVDPSVIAPGEMVEYTVQLTNITGGQIEVSHLVDTLPDTFEYVGLAPGSAPFPPSDSVEPDIEWSDPIPIPASSSVAIRYWVHVPGSVPLSATPYTNMVVATYNGSQYTDEADLMVGIGAVTINKAATPRHVQPGGLVTYTVSFDNSGYVPMSLEAVTDVLPSGVTFDSMTADSDVQADPIGSDTIVWTSPPDIPAQDELVFRYTAFMPVTSDTLQLENQAWGELEDGTVLGPTGMGVRVATTQYLYLPIAAHFWIPPYFEATKTANPTFALPEEPGEMITYTVELSNPGTEPGVLADIRDTLPAGFTFQGMLPGSDITDPPSGTTGEITWAGPFTVDGGTSLTLLYQVQATAEPGTYVNSVTVTTIKGRPPEAPATATVRVSPPILLEENWSNPNPNWEPFVNYWRLNWLQWHIDAGIGVNGSPALNHTYWYGVTDPADGAHDALYMYNEPSAYTWENYRLEAKVKMDLGESQGFWVRGVYIPSELRGRHFEGYYVVLKPAQDVVKISYISEEGPWAYHFTNATEIARATYVLQKGAWYDVAIEVRDSNIKVWVDDNLVLNVNDSRNPNGTVGFFAYKVVKAAWDNIVVTPLP